MYFGMRQIIYSVAKSIKTKKKKKNNKKKKKKNSLGGPSLHDDGLDSGCSDGSFLTLPLLNTTCTVLANRVDPDKLASEDLDLHCLSLDM